MSKFGFYFNREESEYMNFSIIKRKIEPIPKKRYRDYEVSGRNGKVYEDLGTYEDIEISFDCNFMTKMTRYNDWEDDFNQQLDWICNWIYIIEDNTLYFTDSGFDYVYKVNKAEIINLERPMRNICKFTIVFICKPFKYTNNGQKFINLASNLTSVFPMTSKPLYEITGTGLCEITCNGSKVSISVNGKAYIDCELGLCYDANNNVINNKMTGYYEDLYYKNGTNTFSWTSGFKIRFKTNAIRL